MREIKFRGRRIDTGEWVYGFPVTSVNGRAYIIAYATEDAVNTQNELDFIYTEVAPETVGQYTGLKDKNGVEIYEGDVVAAWSEGCKAKGEVKQRIDGMWLMYPAWQSGAFWGLMPNEKGQTTVVVVGNIHEGVTE